MITAPGVAWAAYYSLRFGPGRRLHGHEDHLGITYHAHGRDIVVEAGFHSYERTSYQQWTYSPEAHSVPIVVDAEFRESVPTHLTASSAEPGRQSFTLSDDAYGARRTRSVLVDHGLGAMVVHDTVETGSMLRTLWHVAPGLAVLSARNGRVVLGKGDWRASITQLAPPSGKRLTGQEVRHSTISTGYLKTAETSVVESPAAPAVLTVIVPGHAHPAVTWADGGLSVRTSQGEATFPLST
ncbi:heparinase II/III domain-containing protein [Sinosporangium siamense]|uniref:heparinase II/III domain-containing protein n=1 Tax=Sinosporangium siamense TaxID=1367973 RepID=UPI001950D3D9|nr:heparinase II/III family protein [Sinosporangium siamense]